MKWYLENFWKYKDLLKQLVIRDIKLKYRRSFLGYLWSVLNPLLIMLVMVIVFQTLFKSNIENFAVYLLSGQVMFNFMSGATQGAIFSVVDSGALIKKTYVPKYIFVLARVTSGLVDYLFSLGALLVVMICTEAKFSLYNAMFPLVALQLYIFSTGLGLLLAQANVFFRDIQYIYNALITAWSYLTPLFYPIEILPDNVRWCIENLNPMYFFIKQFRDCIYYNQMPERALMIKGFAVACVVLGIGVVFFKRNQGKFILYI